MTEVYKKACKVAIVWWYIRIYGRCLYNNAIYGFTTNAYDSLIGIQYCIYCHGNNYNIVIAAIRTNTILSMKPWPDYNIVIAAIRTITILSMKLWSDYNIVIIAMTRLQYCNCYHGRNYNVVIIAMGGITIL